MIDFHCHIDLYPQPEDVLRRVKKEGLYLLAVTTTPSAWHGTCQLIGRSRRVRVALGLHPELVHERHGELELFRSLLPKAQYIGEIGLDGSPQNRPHFALQQQVFIKILSACAEQGGRVMTLHSRAAATAVLDAVAAYPSAGIPVLHWFSGAQRELDRAVRLGCYFSIGPAMLRSEKGKRLARSIPPERVLTETDGPFARKGKEPLMPWDVRDALLTLAEIWDRNVEDVNRQTKENLKRILSAVSNV